MTIKEFNIWAEASGGCDRTINQWQVIDIHEIPKPFPESSEVEFYCCSDDKVILLRLINRKKENYAIVHNPPTLPCWIAELPIHNVNNKLIQSILLTFESA